MRFYSILLFYFTATTFLSGQDYDNNWLFGYSTYNLPFDTAFGTSRIIFDSLENPEVQFEGYSQIDFKDCNVSMSNQDGEYIFSFNGYYIEDASNNIMEGGDYFNPYNPEAGSGYRLPQGAICLPYPGHSGKYILIHGTYEKLVNYDDDPAITRLYYSEIDMNMNSGLGKVMKKKELIFLDTLQFGFITACKHANGRDWWIIENEYNTNNFYRILLEPNGIFWGKQVAVGDTAILGLGQAVFTPDGEKYIIFSATAPNTGQVAEIYDFDRCTGELSNHRRIQSWTDDFSFSGGAAISPNSRFLYTPSDHYIFQYDLWAEDIGASKDTVARFDGFFDESTFFSSRFYLAQLAPDGKIYISAKNSVHQLTVIHHPDKAGDACMVEQHGLVLPTWNAFSMPNFPNYRLGPLDGSPCDTLGMDNQPIAKFRYWQDTTDLLSISFTDLSYYEPATWFWDFGDGSTGTERNPWHFFSEPGIYEVCLTVTNEYSSHTKCRELYLGVTATGTPASPIAVSLYPNPADDYFYLQYSATERVDAVLYDGLGRAIQQKRLVLGNDRSEGWDVSHLSGGIYYLMGYTEGEVVFRKKVVLY